MYVLSYDYHRSCLIDNACGKKLGYCFTFSINITVLVKYLLSVMILDIERLIMNNLLIVTLMNKYYLFRYFYLSHFLSILTFHWLAFILLWLISFLNN